jgi:hypothetical protein
MSARSLFPAGTSAADHLVGGLLPLGAWAPPRRHGRPGGPAA